MSNGQPPVLFTVTDGVATITLNSPPTRNAFGGDMPAALSDAYRRCDADDDVRAVVFTGTPPAFCSGADLSEGGDTFRRRDESTFSAAAVAMTAWQVRKPVIAAVNGHAIGVGLTLALQCDIRIFAGEAKYGIVQVRRGVMGDGFSHWTLPRITGMSGAAEILLTGKLFDGADQGTRSVPDGPSQCGGASRRPGPGSRHRDQYRTAVRRVLQSASLANLAAQCRRRRTAGNRLPSPAHGGARFPRGCARLLGEPTAALDGPGQRMTHASNVGVADLQ